MSVQGDRGTTEHAVSVALGDGLCTVFPAFNRIALAGNRFAVHDVGVRAEYGLNIVGPDDIGGTPGLFLLLDVTVADVGQAQRLVSAFAEDFGDGAADGSEADEGYTCATSG